MNIQEWAEEVKAELRKFEEVDLGYPKQKNEILPVVNAKLIEALAQKLNRSIPDQFRTFYQMYGGLELPNIYNGYSIDSLELIIRYKELLLPMKISYPNGQEVGIIPFGSDMGGNLFVLRLNGANSVLYLPTGLVENNVYFPSEIDEVRELANDFYGFLDRLLSDLKAAVRQDSDWTYMTE